jgi:hypothetical protein
MFDGIYWTFIQELVNWIVILKILILSVLVSRDPHKFVHFLLLLQDTARCSMGSIGHSSIIDTMEPLLLVLAVYGFGAKNKSFIRGDRLCDSERSCCSISLLSWSLKTSKNWY